MAALLVAGCADIVLNPISPQQARQQVIDVSRQVVTDLDGELVKANFGYESCNDAGKAPYRGHTLLLLWMPGVEHSREVQPETVLNRLRDHGWQTDADFHSHAATFKRDTVDVSLRTTTLKSPNDSLGGHVIIDVWGECRDMTDHGVGMTPAEDVLAELTSK